jgi:aldehyde dehydrogenase (NAD+)
LLIVLDNFMHDFLTALKLHSKNFGASTGDSQWSTTTEEGHIISYNPTTEQPIASVYSASLTDYKQIITTSEHAFSEWRSVPAPKRGELIRLIGNALRQQKEALGSLVSLETGKSKQEGLGEVQEMIDMADFAVGQSRMLYGNTMQSERPLHRMYEQWHPLGVIGVMTAFNFPVAVWAWNAFIAAVCGNTVIWKPSSKTPLSALAVQHICNHVMKEAKRPGIFSLFITHDNALVQQIVKDPRISLVSFTGSTSIGKEIHHSVTNRFGKTILELSGNNAIIVDETADLSLAVPAIVFGAIGTAGQRCTTTRRLFIQENIYDALLHQLKKAYQTISVGDPLDEKNLMGPLIDQSAVTHFEKAIDEIKKAGGHIICGGKRINRIGFFVEPTLVEAKNEWPVVQRETFAPILYLMKFKTLEEAIKMQNDSPYGLSSALFTRDLHHAELFLSARGSDCGIANINIGTSGAEIGGAFGGEKHTGGGREAGSDAWKAYMRRQTTTINWSSDLPLAQGLKFNIK